MNIICRILICNLFFATPLVYSQVAYDFGFSRDFTVNVNDSLGNAYSLAWTGGLNSCQFNSTDLDGDGISDLVVFDKCGNRILTFINGGTPGVTDYSYNYLFQEIFPPIESWMLMKDYNCDGKNDIFCFTSLGIKLYRDEGIITPNYVEVANGIMSDMGMGFSNISLTPDDYPGIADLDNDGDLDILVFFQLGNFIIMHKNRSVEVTGNCDSILYQLTQNCWGNVSESSNSSHIFTGITCPWKCNAHKTENKQIEHTGSSMLLKDIDNDSDKDLILGDLDFNNLNLLINGGTPDSANITSVDSLFPSNSVPVNITSFPVATSCDINNDGKEDILVSPFYSNIVMPDGLNSIWLYNDVDSGGVPLYQYQMNDFLQSDMIDLGTGSHPSFFDYDADGLMDMIVGNYGYLDSSYVELGSLKTVFNSRLALYRNTGSVSIPSFQLMDSDYATLSVIEVLGLTPSFGDVDDDGDIDMLCGESKGTLIYLVNTAGQGNTAVFAPPQMNYQGIDIGDYSSPCIVDLDGDSLPDLVVGKRNGMLNYYRNTGSPTIPVFTLENDSLGLVNVTNYQVSYTGHSTPCFFRDTVGNLRLFCGSESGKVFHYKDIEANINGKFTATDSLLIYTRPDSATRIIHDGIRSAVAVHDLDADGYQDMVYGNFSGGLSYYKGSEPKPFANLPEQLPPLDFSFRIFPNPASSAVTLAFDGEGQWPASLSIMDFTGRVVMEFNIITVGNRTIDVSRLDPGLYFFSLLIEQPHPNAHRAVKTVIITR